MAEFSKLRGQRVFLEMPKKDEGKLYVDENTKEALQNELVLKMRKLKVYAVGDLVTDFYKGDYVLVDHEALSKAKIVPLSEAKSVLMVSSFDVAVIW